MFATNLNTSNGTNNGVLATRRSNTDKGFEKDEESLQSLLNTSVFICVCFQAKSSICKANMLLKECCHPILQVLGPVVVDIVDLEGGCGEAGSTHVDISLVWIDPLITLALTLLQISISEGNSAKSEGHTPKFCNDAMVATQFFPTLHEHY